MCLRLVADDTLAHKVLLGALLSLLGLTLVLANTPLMSEISYAIAAEEAARPGVFGEGSAYGLGYGLFCTSFALGGFVGSLMSGYVMAGRGWDTLTWALAVWTAGGAVVVGLAVGNEPAPEAEAGGGGGGGGGRGLRAEARDGEVSSSSGRSLPQGVQDGAERS